MKYVITFLLCLHSLFAVEVFANNMWKAKWISKSQTQSQTNTWLAFRKNVSIESVPETLIARMAADTKYWLWINGRLVVFEGGLKRGFSPSSTYYDEVDIAQMSLFDTVKDDDVLEELKKYDVSGIVATHDLGLAEAGEKDSAVFSNYRFEIELSDEIRYTYRISPGIARNMNASYLIRKILDRQEIRPASAR